MYCFLKMLRLIELMACYLFCDTLSSLHISIKWHKCSICEKCTIWDVFILSDISIKETLATKVKLGKIILRFNHFLSIDTGAKSNKAEYIDFLVICKYLCNTHERHVVIVKTMISFLFKICTTLLFFSQ